jgi:putative FmdB family regulatory protein
MPLYEYKCENCGFRFEVLVLPQKYEKNETIKCPNCGSENVKQTLSTFTSYSSCGSGKRGFFT